DNPEPMMANLSDRTTGWGVPVPFSTGWGEVLLSTSVEVGEDKVLTSVGEVSNGFVGLVTSDFGNWVVSGRFVNMD
ncbi:MAG: hypothetical protein ACTS47_02145, partial [Candidatus Hodgkinia cicadicola]